MDPHELIILLLVELAGALFGAFYGVKWGYQKAAHHEREMRKEDEKERKDETVKSLIAEVTSIKMIVDKGLKQKPYLGRVNVNYIAGFLSTDAFDSAVFSGGYQLLTINTQRNATFLFIGCKRMNRLLERLEDIQDSERGLLYVSSEIARIYSGLKVSTSDVLSILQKELGYDWKINVIDETGNDW